MANQGRGRRFKLQASLFLIGMAMTGCGLQPSGEAENARVKQQLDRTLDLLEQEKPEYRIQSEVSVGGANLSQVQTAAAGSTATEPAAPKLEELVGLLRQGGYRAAAQEDKAAPLDLHIEAAASDAVWTDWNKRYWQGRMQAMEAAALDRIRKEEKGLQESTASALREAMTTRLQQAKGEMSDRLTKLQASGVCTFHYKSGKRVPYSVVVENRLRYSESGDGQEEVVRTTYYLGSTGSISGK